MRNARLKSPVDFNKPPFADLYEKRREIKRVRVANPSHGIEEFFRGREFTAFKAGHDASLFFDFDFNDLFAEFYRYTQMPHPVH